MDCGLDADVFGIRPKDSGGICAEPMCICKFRVRNCVLNGQTAMVT